MNDVTAAQPALKASGAFFVETVTWVHHWTPTLFSFRTTRDPGLRFSSGQFLMVGLQKEDGKPLVRAYSVASPSWHEELEFYSIKVPDGPLTSRLQNIKVGDPVLIGRKPTGTLVLDGLKPGKRLYMLGTGTGLAPWLSLARDPEVYDRFETVVVTHTVREVGDLNYVELFEKELAEDEILSEVIGGKLHYYPTVTREEFRTKGRITDLIASGRLFADLGLPPLDPAEDRVMLCGGPSVLADLKQQLLDLGYVEGSLAQPGDFVLEKAFVET
ncbi:MAG: ferredoxin--NADP reductase [Alphaproteobacteria bacterium]|nr:ferredoxin--NADP reductase [Alphaproteobacteria bacterium]MBU1516968.1 ferredoxin--NADP reductase [Alphaproteobacteria bacterium]MBU2095856.1 ferredoxin--NADP reductase [Alphaproteobacteria bacterium]MBU2152007.1 ferredoxin--NADP reductase [Alphaproteobacteria bacterium]MBU2309528.1 ferredoxin--NADP reductase [Alphaproteobacteria bacterium]